MPGRMSAAKLASGGGGYEPQRAYNFEIDITGFPGDTEALKFAIQNFTPPGANNDPIDLPYLNEVVYVAGQGRWDTADVMVRDFVDKTVYKDLTEWKKLVHDPQSGNIGFASDYKKEGDVYLIDPKGGGDRLYHMVGLWPTTLRGDSLDYGAGSVYNISMTLSVDRAYPQF